MKHYGETRRCVAGCVRSRQRQRQAFMPSLLAAWAIRVNHAEGHQQACCFVNLILAGHMLRSSVTLLVFERARGTAPLPMHCR
eukprot:5266798-Alexandrium_andersonii.AAC.1